MNLLYATSHSSTGSALAPVIVRQLLQFARREVLWFARKRKRVRVARASVRSLADLFGLVRFGNVTPSGSFDIGDPGKTGSRLGQVIRLTCGTTGSPRIRIDLEPGFVEAVLTERPTHTLSVISRRIVTPVGRFDGSAFGPVR